VLWNEYLDNEPNEFNPLYFYLANIAKEVAQAAQAQAKHPKKIELKSKLLKFEKVKRLVPETKDYESAMLNSKRAWLTAVGLRHKLKGA
jgi:hypothetical protein